MTLPMVQSNPVTPMSRKDQERMPMPAPPDIRSLIEGSTAHFQPIVDLNTGQVLGAETLVRFIGPDGKIGRAHV